MPRKPKTELQRLLEESIKLAREGRLHLRRDALGRRLKDLDDVDAPTSLDDPDEIRKVESDEDDW